MKGSGLFFHADNNNYFLGYKNLISLGMTKDEYDRALDQGHLGSMSKAGRLIVHEYAHWVQSAGTPYGYFLELVRHYENELLRRLEELIAERLHGENGIRVAPPFKRYVEERLFYTIQDEELWKLFQQWIDLYFLTLVTDKRRDLYYDAVRRHKGFFASYPECESMRDAENYMYLPRLFCRTNDFLDERLSAYIGRSVPVKNRERGALYSEKNQRAAMASGANGMSLLITHHSLWESYATVVEYVDTPEEFGFPSCVDVASGKRMWDEYHDPLRYLQLYLPSAKYDTSLFLRSCICVFDIVFSPPVLPQCVLLREEEISMFDFDLVSRFYAAAEAARFVGPMSGYRSMGEYMSAICRALNWRTPDEVFYQLYRCWDSLNVIPAGEMFQKLLVMRMSGEYLPLNRARFLCELREERIWPGFLKLKDRMIFDPAAHGKDFYRYHLLRELVERLWEEDARVITLEAAETCEELEDAKAYLRSWLEEHFIDVQLEISVTGYGRSGIKQ